jgi:TATA-box binding protein (TBP) (component of TFIID and TFIIIB)
MEGEESIFKITNSTITFRLGIQFTSPQYIALARNGINTEYRPHKFHAIIMRIRHPQQGEDKATALIFRSGRIVLTGLKRPDLGKFFARRCAKSLHKSLRMANEAELADQIRVQNIFIQNVVATIRLPHRLNIVRMYNDLQKRLHSKANTIYFPSPNSPILFGNIKKVSMDFTIFPALRLKIELCREKSEEGKESSKIAGIVSILIFATGRIIFTGFRDTNLLHQFSPNIKNLFQEYKII